MRKDPKLATTRIEEWTKIEKEVVYLFLGPGSIHTLDPTIKPKLVEPSASAPTCCVAWGV